MEESLASPTQGLSVRWEQQKASPVAAGTTPRRSPARSKPVSIVDVSVAGAREGSPADASLGAPATAANTCISQRMVNAFGRNDIGEVVRFVEELPHVQRSTVRDAAGRTVLHLACIAPTSDILVELLLERRGLTTRVVDFDGNSALHTAASVGSLEHVRILTQQRGIPLSALNGYEQTPADLALDNGYEFVATNLRERDGGGDEARDLAIETWPQRVTLLDATVDSQLVWRELETLAHLQVAVPLTPLPWTSPGLPEITRRARFAVSPSPPKFVAGMILIDDEYQFDGIFFKEALDLHSPHGTGTRLTVYESLVAPKLFLECIVARLPTPVHVLRLTAPLTDRSLEEIAPDLRAPEPFEELFFSNCGPTIRQALQSHSLDALDTAAHHIRRAWRQHSRQLKFIAVMKRLTDRVASVKSFLRTTMVARRLAVVGLAGCLKKFEAHARGELKAVGATIYPAMVASIAISPLKRAEAVRKGLEFEKQEHLRRLRLHASDPAGTAKPLPFRYVVPLDSLFPFLVAAYNVEKVCQYLLSRKSYLPRSTILALQRRTTTLSVDEMARSRLTSVLTDIYTYYVRQASWAAMRTEKMKSNEALQNFIIEENARKLREQKENAARVASFIGRLSDQTTGNTRAQKRSNEHLSSHGPPQQPPQLVSIRDVIRGRGASDEAVVAAAAVSRPPALRFSDGDALAGDGSTDRPTSPRNEAVGSPALSSPNTAGLLQVPSGRAFAPRPPLSSAGGSSAGAAARREGSTQKVRLVCDTRSPIPNVVGPKHNVKRLLVRWTSEGKVTGADERSMMKSLGTAPRTPEPSAAAAADEGGYSSGDGAAVLAPTTTARPRLSVSEIRSESDDDDW